MFEVFEENPWKFWAFLATVSSVLLVIGYLHPVTFVIHVALVQPMITYAYSNGALEKMWEPILERLSRW